MRVKSVRNAGKRKGKTSRKRKDLMSQLERKIPTQVIAKMVQEEVKVYFFTFNPRSSESKKEEERRAIAKKTDIKGKKVYKK